MEHRYSVGDRVTLAFGFHDQDATGTYEVVVRLPTRPDGDPQYRIRDRDGRERVIGEAQIGEPGKPTSSPRPRSVHNPITDELNRQPRKTDI